jgi:tetratricopeptide (TPR) repeat protein
MDRDKPYERDEDWTGSLVHVDNPAMDHVRRAIGLRRQRKFFEALDAFDQAIARASAGDSKLLSYAYAHRGETKMALGYYCNEEVDLLEAGVAPDAHHDHSRFPSAISDFKKALQFNGRYGWALAQLGEAHRCQARTYYQMPASDNFRKHIEWSLRYFEQAEAYLPDTTRPWILAHMAASLMARLEHNCEMAEDHSTDIFETEDGERAHDLLQAALKQNPRYAWARRCHAFLHALRWRLDLSIKEFGEASLDNPNSDLHLLRAMALLTGHASEWPDQGDGADEERRKELLERSVYCSQLVLEQDSEDILARAAYAMALLKQMYGSGEPDAAFDDRARLISASARAELLNALARLLMFSFELAVLASPHGKMEDIIDELRSNIHQMFLPQEAEGLWKQPVLKMFRRMNPMWDKSQDKLFPSRSRPAGDAHGSRELSEHFDRFLQKLFNQPTRRGERA